MFQKVLQEKVKIVHKDGNRYEISLGILTEYDKDTKTIKIIKDSGKIVYINTLAIHKVEVL